MQKFVELLLGVSAVCFASFGPLRGSEPDNRSFVLMNNGSVFHGVVRPVGEKMEIRLGQDATIQVDSKQVGHIAASKLELYQDQPNIDSFIREATTIADRKTINNAISVCVSISFPSLAMWRL
jgi:hypothetical protein